MDCTQPGECNHGMMLHFGSTNFPAEFGVPAFAEWLQENPPEGQYRTHKRMLQQFQWKGPRGRWTLKSPQHLFDLPGLVEAYPGAMLVRSEEHTSELQSLMRISYAVFCLKKKKIHILEILAQSLI